MADERATWIFQANPSLYDIHQSLKVEAKDLWGCVQYATKIRAGDRALIWISGKRAGIYAVGTVLSDPMFRPDSSIGMKYWSNPADGHKPRPRAWVKYEKVLIDNPLLKKYLLWDPDLSNLSILGNPRGTNFKVSGSEWVVLETWLKT
jgi:hypothetical protein